MLREPAKTRETVTTRSQLLKWLSRIQNAVGFVAIDTETTGLDPMTAELVGVSVAVRDADRELHSCYIPVGHTELAMQAHAAQQGVKQLDLDTVLAWLSDVFATSPVRFVLHNAGYDYVVLTMHGIDMTNVVLDDTLLMSYSISGRQHPHDMDYLADKYLNHRTILFDDVVRPGLGMTTFADVPLYNATEYAAEDTEVTLRLCEYFCDTADLDTYAYFQLDRPLIAPMARMKLNGMGVSRKQMAVLTQEWTQIIDNEVAAFAAIAPGVNLGSTQQLGKYVYDTLKMPVIARTETGNPKVDADTLALMEDDHPALKHVAVAKKYQKLVSTYTDAIPRLINPYTHRLHTHIGLTSTVTARFSSSEPNLQNIPSPSNEKNAEQGKRIRSAFIASKGRVIVSADYSQIELRVLAQITQDPALLKAFLEGLDVHATTAATVFGERWDRADADERKVLRRFAKTINFGLIYGMTAHGLAKQLKISEEEAQEFIDTYFAKLPRVMQWAERQKLIAVSERKVTTLFGRTLFLPRGLNPSALGRCGMNYPIQGSAADVVRLAIPRVEEALRHHGLDAPMLLQVHDELLFEPPAEQAAEVCSVVKHTMETAADNYITWVLPILVDAQAGPSWAEAH